jgi:hypothetical protein
MAKFISTSLVLVLFVVAIMINGAYSDSVIVPDPIDKECRKWQNVCLVNPTSIACGWYAEFCKFYPRSKPSTIFP